MLYRPGVSRLRNPQERNQAKLTRLKTCRESANATCHPPEDAPTFHEKRRGTEASGLLDH
jgi:hypothetical protein